MQPQPARSPHVLIGAAGACAVLGVLLLTPRLDFDVIATGAGRGDTARAWDRETVGQTFRLARDGLTEIAITTDPILKPDAVVEFRVLRAQDPEPLRVVRGPVREFRSDDGRVLRFRFPPLSGIAGSPVAFTLAAPGLAREDALGLRVEIASSLYPDGQLHVNGAPREGDLGFTARVRGTTGESWRHRLLVGNAGQWFAGIALAILAGLVIAELTSARRRAPDQGRHLRLTLWSSLALALLYTFPLYAHLGNWADDESDWPEVVSYFSATRHALAAGQFPGWNPYICGGAPHFANPQAFFMALPLPFALLFGDVVGPKVALTVVIALGLAGAALLGKTLGLRNTSAALPAIVFMFSGFTTTHLANGQLLWLTLAWIPWIVLGFLRALHNPWWSLVAAGFLTLTFVEGRLYLVAYAALLLTLLGSILALQRRSVRPLAVLALVGVLTLLGSAWKLLPALAFLSDTEASLGNASGISLRALDEAFFRRDVTPNVTDRTEGLDLPRHEYAAYVGILPFLLALFSLRRETRARALPFLFAGAAFLVLAIQPPESALLELFPLTRELRNPSRMLSMVVFSVAIASGFGLSALQHFLTASRSGTRDAPSGLSDRAAPVSAEAPEGRRRTSKGAFPEPATVGPAKKARGALVPLLALLLILGDLLAVGWTHLAPLFRQPPSSIAFDEPGFLQTRLPVERQVNNGYPAVAAGYGAKDFCPVVLRAYRARHNVLAREDAGYRGEVRAVGQSLVVLTRFSPNALDVTVQAAEHDTIVVNQQYDRGWSAHPFLTRNYDTLLAVDVPPGTHTVRLRYRTPFLGVGSAISLALLAGVALLWRFRIPARRIASLLRARIKRYVRWRGVPLVIVAATALAAGLLVTARPQALWGERHPAHLHKPHLVLSSGHTVRQTFQWEADVLDLVVLWVDPGSPRPLDGELLLTVETPSGARTATASLADIPPSGTVLLPIRPPLRGRAGESGALSVRLAHAGQKVSLQYQIAAGIYPAGSLALEGIEKQGDLAFQLRYRRPALHTLGVQWGYAALLLAAGVIVAAAAARRPLRPPVHPFSRRDLLLALAAGVLAAGVYHRSLIGHGFWTGASDLSKDAAYLASADEALDQRAWPVWSHRTCGGMLLLGNPEGNTVSLGTLFATILHADQALLSLLVVEAGLAAAGSFLLARTLGFSAGAGLAAAAVASLSASFPYRIMEGLTPVGGAVAFTSWALLALFRALETSSGRAAIASGTLLAAVFFRGDVHVLVGVLFVVAAIALWVAIQQRSRTPLMLLGVIGATFFLWSSVKILPYQEHPTLVGGELPPYVVPLTRFGLLDDALLRTHDRGGIDVKPLHDRRYEQWGNFGAYVGVLPLALAGIGLFHRYPFRGAVLTGAVASFLLSEGELFETVLRHLDPLGVLLRVPTRLFSLFAFFLALLAASGTDRLRRIFPLWPRRAVTAALLTFLVFDLGRATTSLFTRNLLWSGGRTLPSPAGPTLLEHQNASPDQERHATKLLHAGYLLPRICGDQNNPPPFTREVREPLPLATVRSQLFANRVLLDAPTGPSDVAVRERFVPAWSSTKGAVLQHDDGGLHVVLPKMETGPVELRFEDPLAAAQGVLLALFLAHPFFLLRRFRERKTGEDAATATSSPASAVVATPTVSGYGGRSMVRIILPAYNEAENLPELVRNIAATLGTTDYRIVAVNDGSRDSTLAVLEDLARRFPITVLDHVVNKGVAAAFRTGFAAALKESADDDVVILMEGDGTSTPSLLPEMVRRIRAGADVVIASRYQPRGGYRNFPLKRLILSRGANAAFRLIFPMAGVTDYTIFYRAYRVPPLRAATTVFGNRFIESTTFLANAEILVKLRPFVRRVEEVPLLYDYGRKKGRTGMKVWKNLRSYVGFIARQMFQAKGPSGA